MSAQEVIVMPELPDEPFTLTGSGGGCSLVDSSYVSAGVTPSFLVSPSPAPSPYAVVAATQEESLIELRADTGDFILRVRNNRLELNANLPPDDLARQFVLCVNRLLESARLHRP